MPEQENLHTADPYAQSLGVESETRAYVPKSPTQNTNTTPNQPPANVAPPENPAEPYPNLCKNLLFGSAGSETYQGICQEAAEETGVDFSRLAIIANSRKADDANAKAMLLGDEVHYATGMFCMDAPESVEIFRHEVQHYIQQQKGQVEATNLSANQNPDLEKSAENAEKGGFEKGTDGTNTLANEEVAQHKPTKPFSIELPQAKAGNKQLYIINNKEAVVLDIVTNEAWYLENADEKVHGLQHFEENRAAWKPFAVEDYRACDMTPPKNLAAANANTNPAQTGTGLPFAQWVKGKNDGIYQYYQAGDLTIRVSASNFKYTYEFSTNSSTQPAISVTTPKKEKNNSWQPYTITEPRIPIAYNEIFMDEPFEHLETVRTSPSTNEFAFEAWLDAITVTPNAPAPSFLGLEIPLNAVKAFAKYAGEVGTTAALWVVQALTEDLKILVTGTDWNGKEGSRLWSLFWAALDTFGVGLVAKFAGKLVRGLARFGGKLAAGFLELVAKLFDKIADFAQLADEVIDSAFAYFAKKASEGAAALKQAWQDTLAILFGQADEVALEGAGGLGKIGVDKVDELAQKPTVLKMDDDPKNWKTSSTKNFEQATNQIDLDEAKRMLLLPESQWDDIYFDADVEGFRSYGKGVRANIFSIRDAFITKDGVENVKAHLAKFDYQAPTKDGYWKHNAMMIDRLEKIASGKLDATDTDLYFYTHELTEKGLMATYFKLMENSGLSSENIFDRAYKKAHAESAKLFGVVGNQEQTSFYTKEALEALDKQMENY